MDTIYLFSGIGCGGSVFERISFPEGFAVRHIGWKEPLAGEDFARYCARMMQGVELSPSDILCGVSFGGIAAQQIARQNPQVRRVVVMSSAVNPGEYSVAIRICRVLRLDRIIPGQLFSSRRLKAMFVTGRATVRGQKAVERFFEPLSPRYYRFAERACLHFRPAEKELLCRIRRIHGHKDALFPVKRLSSPAQDIAGATHLMVYTHAREVSKAFAEVIREPWCPSV